MPKGILLTPEQQEMRREEIMNAALNLIAERGYQKTSMREIAVSANMGKSSLYDFFKTKDEIVIYAVEKQLREIVRKTQQIIMAESSMEQCLRKIMQNHLNIPKQHRTVMMWLNAESAYLEEGYRKRLKTARYAYQDTIKSVIDKGVKEGIFRETDTSLAVRLLINSILSVLYTSRPSDSAEKMLDETMNIFLYGIRKRGGE